jgi:hypothetical protein
MVMLKSDPPGCAPAYKFPVDIAKFDVLKALAVLAFTAAITRLPGHCAARFGPLKAIAQTTPSRFTTAAHSWLPSPPLAPEPSLITAVNVDFRVLKSGSFEQSCALWAHTGLCAQNAIAIATSKPTKHLIFITPP